MAGSYFFPSGTYSCNIIGNGDDNVSIIGAGATSIIISHNANDWAIKYDGGFPARITIENIVFKDITNAKTKHGVYINTGVGFSLRNVEFRGLGIGVCINATWGTSFYDCKFSNYCEVFSTASIDTNTSILNVNGQTVSITNAFFNQHPGIQTWVNCHFEGKINYYFEQPDNPYGHRAALIFLNCVSVPANGVGFHFRDGGYFNSISMDNVWLEGSLSNALLRSYTLPGKYIYARESTRISFSNSKLDNVKLEDNAIILAKNCYINDNASLSGTSTIFHDCVLVDDLGGRTILDYVRNGTPITGGRPLFAMTNPKTNLCRAYTAEKMTSNACFAADVMFGDWAATSRTKINTDSIFEKLECFEIVATTNNGVRLASFTTELNKIYIFSIALKGVGQNVSIRLVNNPMGGSGNVVAYQDKWTTYYGIGCAKTIETNTMLCWNGNDASATWRISGFQLLKFDTWGKAFEFLESASFTI